jgi:hypothetical protein
MEDCISALECPVCFQVPRPGDPTWWDCDYGHAICSTCHHQCPDRNACVTCRDMSMMEQPESIPRKKIVEALFQYSFFNCPHPSCSKQVTGPMLDQHAKECKHKIVACPKPGCHFRRSWHEFTLTPLTPCYQLVSAWTREEGWDATFTFEEIFNQSGKKRILTTVLEDNHDKPYCRAVLHFEYSRNRDICFYVTWCDERANCSERVRNQRVLLAANTYVHRGHLTAAEVTRMNFVREDYMAGDETRQLVVPNRQFMTWHGESCRANECTKCHATIQHFHVQVIFPAN